MKNLLALIPLLLFVFIPFSGNAQIFISEDYNIEDLRGGTTYVIMADPESPENEIYKEVYKKYWALSPIDFISYGEIEEHISPENTFISFQWNNLVGKYGTSIHLYLKLWHVNKKFFEKGKEKFGNQHTLIMAYIELFPDFPIMTDQQSLYKMDYSAEGHLRNWGPGYLKNQIQLFNKYLEIGGKHSLFEETVNTYVLQQLKKQTIYIPEYTLIRFDQFSGGEAGRTRPDKLMSKYGYEYKFISNEELNEKILNSEPFYYLVYVKGSTDKYVTVVNSSTGEVIYHEYAPMSYNIKSKDLKKLSKNIY